MNYKHILYQADGPILTVTLNRPDKLNAYTATMGSELADAFVRADQDDAIRAVIVTGAGRGFCAGADLSSGAKAFDTSSGGSAALGNERVDGRQTFIMRIFNCRKPLIAAINGPAVGVGITMALPMDIRIASSDARFGFVFSRRGMVPEVGSAWFLPRIVGISQALRWCYSGRIFGADEALKSGLVSEVTAPEKLLEAARAIAGEIATETAPVSIALIRQMLWRLSAQPDPMAALDVDFPLTYELGVSADVKEGVMAFIEKRRPKFTGRPSKDMPPTYPWWRD